MPTPFTIREGTAADVEAITAIYAYWVTHGLASFELEAPPCADMLERFIAITDDGYPYLVAVDGERLLGYAYASRYRPRPAYRFACENSIYVDADAIGRGVGAALMQALIDACTGRGLRSMIAVIGDSQNHASIGLHQAFGFQHTGTLPNIGWKHGRWVDTVEMILQLGAGSSTPPDDNALKLAKK